jgi:hypothetical protein
MTEERNANSDSSDEEEWLPNDDDDDDEDYEYLGRLAETRLETPPQRRSIKLKNKSAVEKPVRRSARHTLRKNYQEEELPDDDHYICKLSVIFSRSKWNEH